MQFVNIVVHSVEDMNFRVHLQHEFTLLGLDAYLDVSCAAPRTNPPTKKSLKQFIGQQNKPCS